MTLTTIAIPLKLGAALNARVHWTARAKRSKTERAIVRASLAHRQDLRCILPPSTCTLVRVAPRALDDDNLAGAFKSIRDEVAFSGASTMGRRVRSLGTTASARASRSSTGSRSN